MAKIVLRAGSLGLTTGDGGGEAELIEKSISENGVYNASDDEADGYSKVTVNLPLDSKSITSNGTYLASSDNLQGYSSVSVEVSASVQIQTFDSLAFDGNTYIELPINLVSPNRSYFIDFTTETQDDASGNHTLFGIKNQYYGDFVGIRYANLRYQVGQNGASTNIQNSWDELTGRHTFLYNGSGTVSFDNGAHTYNYSPSNTTGDGYALCIGSAGSSPRSGNTWKGLLHEFKVVDTSDNSVVADYVPAAKVSGSTIIVSGLYDTVSQIFITPPSVLARNES